ncbi:zinc-binding dehydrogenase [Microbacterium sp. B2969]|uniref:enoyl-[acyl-carrier-protein] reductase n=1 Tax=Microbacterium alkaliflavum TaxID=3248839 RepID=A0ABW7Q490_9MICO
MRALIHHSFGDPAEVLAVEEVPTPEPGPGQALVRMVLSPIHNHDLWTVQGTYGYKPELPARAGTEAVGVVEAVGAGVTGLTPGRRVATGGTFGVWAERFVASAAGLIRVPDGLSDETAAQLVSMPFSAIALLDHLDLREGEWFVQNAANGAVGRLLAQLAAARGVEVVGLVRRSAGVDELAAQGIRRVVATDHDGWRDEVLEITGGKPITAGVDSVGGTASGDVLSLLAENGTLVVFGAMASPVMQLGSGDVIFKQATVKGFWGSRVSATMDPQRRAALLGELLERIRSGALTLPVHATYSFDDIALAARANFEPGRAGKVLLRP